MFYGVIILFLISSCKEKPNEIEPKTVPQEEQWELIPGFEAVDVRYMLVHDRSLYVACIDTKLEYPTEGRGLLLRTDDGINWEKVRKFKSNVGPMTTRGDSIYILMDDSIYSYQRRRGWKSYCRTPYRLSDPTLDGDIVFLRDTLYGMVSKFVGETYRIHSNGKADTLYPMGYITSGFKFIKVQKNYEEKVYLRPDASAYTCFFEFNGEKFLKCMKGLSQQELNSQRNPTNSMTVKDNTLYAAFLFPAVIKYLNQADEWINFTDTLPNHKQSDLYKPKLREETTALTFSGNRLFVSTRYSGVLEWREGEWVKLSKGLRLCKDEEWSEELYHLVNFLESFKGYLFAGYGMPAYAPWMNPQGNAGFGLYRRKIPE